MTDLLKDMAEFNQALSALSDAYRAFWTETDYKKSPQVHEQYLFTYFHAYDLCEKYDDFHSMEETLRAVDEELIGRYL